MRPQALEVAIAFARGFAPDHGFQQLLIEWLEQLQPMLALPLHDWRHLSQAQLLLAVPGKQAAAPGKAGLEGQRVETVLARGADLYQLLPLAQPPHYFATLHCLSMQTGKLIMEHHVQNEFGVAQIVLLPPTSPA